MVLMEKFNTFLMQFACFLTGYRFDIVNASSEETRRKVKKYFGALVIISLLWSYIGYHFSLRYLKLETWQAILGAYIAIFLVIQIERQILLSDNNDGTSKILKFTLPQWIRLALGIVMAFIGAIIIDQKIYQDDIEKKKEFAIMQEVDSLLPGKTREIENQMREISAQFESQNAELQVLVKEVNEKPFLPITNYSTNSQKDSSGKEIGKTHSISTGNVPNPKSERITPLQSSLNALMKQKGELEEKKRLLRENLTTESKQRNGFLDELILLFEVVTSHWIGIIVYCVFFLFFLMIELFIVFNKVFQTDDDYEKVLAHQKNARSMMIEKLGKIANE